jgi:hypothetical protein
MIAHHYFSRESWVSIFAQCIPAVSPWGHFPHMWTTLRASVHFICDIKEPATCKRPNQFFFLRNKWIASLKLKFSLPRLNVIFLFCSSRNIFKHTHPYTSTLTQNDQLNKVRTTNSEKQWLILPVTDDAHIVKNSWGDYRYGRTCSF